MKEASDTYIPSGYILPDINELYQKALSIWEGAFTEAYLEGKSHDEKHKIRRDKLTEYLMSLPPELLTKLREYAEARCIEQDGIYMQYPKPIHKKARAAGRALITLIEEVEELGGDT